jgi:preprotein translocase subunit YajC
VPLTSHALAVLAAKNSGGGGIVSFLPLILIVLVGYFLLIRPARMRQRKALENRTGVTPGVEVTTTAGILATVVSVDEDGDVVTLEIAPGVQARFLKGAIARVHTPFEEEPEAMTGEHEAITDPEPTPGSDAGPPEQIKPEQTDH